MRGSIHLYSAWFAIIAGAVLVSVSWAVASPRAGHSTLVYAAATVAMFAVSATYHRVQWKSPTARMRMKRLDHSMIFVFIAGSYTPFARLAMPQNTGVMVLWIVWGGALAGIALKVCWPSAPRWVGVPLYLLLGWVAVWFAPRSSTRRAWRRWCYWPSAECYTASVACSTGYAGPTRGPRPSAITKSSTPAPRSPPSCTTSPCGLRSSTSARDG